MTLDDHPRVRTDAEQFSSARCTVCIGVQGYSMDSDNFVVAILNLCSLGGFIFIYCCLEGIQDVPLSRVRETLSIFSGKKPF